MTSEERYELNKYARKIDLYNCYTAAGIELKIGDEVAFISDLLYLGKEDIVWYVIKSISLCQHTDGTYKINIWTDCGPLYNKDGTIAEKEHVRGSTQWTGKGVITKKWYEKYFKTPEECVEYLKIIK